MFITLNRIEDSITGSYVNPEKTNETINFGIKYSDEVWEAMVKLQTQSNSPSSKEELIDILKTFAELTKDDLKAIVETACPNLYVQKATNKFFLKISGRIIKNEIPQPLVDRILKSIEKKIDPQPIIALCARFMRNPNFSQSKFEKLAWYINQTTLLQKEYDRLIKEGYTADVATERATVFQVAITSEGLLCTYKVSEEVKKKFVKDGDNVKEVSRYESEVDEDTGTVTFKKPEFAEDYIFRPAIQKEGGDEFTMEDIITGATKVGHRIKVGHVHYLADWSKVDCNDSRSCVPGLHVGNLDYIRGYQNQGTITHEVFVDPMDIGAIVQDGTGAIRVLRYFVHRSYVGPNRALYLSSHYAKLTNDQWLKAKADLIAKRETVAADSAELDKDLAAL